MSPWILPGNHKAQLTWSDLNWLRWSLNWWQNLMGCPDWWRDFWLSSETNSKIFHCTNSGQYPLESCPVRSFWSGVPFHGILTFAAGFFFTFFSQKQQGSWLGFLFSVVAKTKTDAIVIDSILVSCLTKGTTSCTTKPLAIFLQRNCHFHSRRLSWKSLSLHFLQSCLETSHPVLAAAGHTRKVAWFFVKFCEVNLRTHSQTFKKFAWEISKPVLGCCFSGRARKPLTTFFAKKWAISGESRWCVKCGTRVSPDLTSLGVVSVAGYDRKMADCLDGECRCAAGYKHEDGKCKRRKLHRNYRHMRRPLFCPKCDFKSWGASCRKVSFH